MPWTTSADGTSRRVVARRIHEPIAIPRVSAVSSRMLVRLSHPNREIEIKGPKRTKDLLRELSLVMEAHLVIRGDELVTEDEMLADVDQIEIRPVISGGR